jgi:hypothetical protein
MQMDQPGCKENVTANIAQTNYFQYIASISQLFMHSHQEFQSFAVHEDYRLAVQDDVASLLVDTFIKGGF